jgi:chaperonin GroES
MRCRNPESIAKANYHIDQEVRKMSFGIKPLGDRVVIKKAEAEEKSEGGIILTSSAQEKPQYAEVVAVGPGTKDEPMEVKVGDTVVFSKYAGTDIKFEGEEYSIMKQSDCLAVIEK